MEDYDFFPSVNLIVSKTCRMRCSFCCAETSNYKACSVDIKKLYEIIDILSKNGTKRICFSGGEPLFNPNIGDLLLYSYNHNMINTIMSSDGIKIAKMNFDTKLVDTFWISVHGIKELHEDITNVNNSFNDIEDAIINNKNGYNFAIWSVVTPKNKDRINELITWCLKLNVKKLYLSNLNESGRGKNFITNNKKISDDEFEKILNYYQENYDGKIAISGQRFSKNAQCTIIYPDGSIYVTPYDNEENQLLLGNVLKEKPKEVFLRLKNNKELWKDYSFRYKNSKIMKNN